MKNPYEVLGVSMYATREQINAAYQQLSRQYAESGNVRKQQELDEAYDRIMLDGDYSSQNVYYGSDFSDIRQRIDSGRLEDAQVLLDGVPESQRNAEWNYLKGTICQKKGWLDDAEKYFGAAVKLDSSNETYKSAYDNVSSYSNGGYKTKGQKSDSDCSCCNICSGLLCADCCCECMGGDLISCC